MPSEFKSLAYGNTASFNWPHECAACGRLANASLTATYAATSNAKFFGFYASWQSQPITLAYPVCRTHRLVYLVPTMLTTMSLGYTVFLALAAIAATGGCLGLLRIGFGAEQFEPSVLGTYIVLLLPGCLVFLSRALAPVRIAYFSPPEIRVRIRRPKFAEEFSKLNPTATEVAH